jgi:isochorismate synthase
MSVASLVTLSARVSRVTTPASVLDHLGDGGFAWVPERGSQIATAGVAAHVPADDAAAVLSEVAVDRCDGAPPMVRPVAVGALGWTLDRSLTIPARTVVVLDDGSAWQIEVGPALEDARPVSRPAVAPTRFDVQAIETVDEWVADVDSALARIGTGEIDKVVLARRVRVTADADLDVAATLALLRRDQPGCVVYADGDLLGASPELLVARRATTVWSRPMAGTVARRAAVDADDSAVEQLVHSAKDSREHALVVDAVVDGLESLGIHPEVSGPHAERFATLTHLVTEVRAEQPDLPDAATLALALHPTPAVGGTPTPDACAVIAELERFDRGTYAGPVGWVDSHGDGELVVALRGATVRGRTAQLVAGAGIVAGSDPVAEWDETRSKLEPVLRAIVRP